MTFIITAHPIYREQQEELGIYSSAAVSKEKVGDVLEALANQGHVHMHISVDPVQQEIHIHCKERP